MLQKYIYFWLLCIPLRLILVYISAFLSKKYLQYLGILLLFPSIGFIFLYFTNLRNKGVFSKVWWKDLRLLHGALFLTASIYCLQKNNLAYIPLLIDVILGIFNWLIHYKFLTL